MGGKARGEPRPRRVRQAALNARRGLGSSVMVASVAVVTFAAWAAPAAAAAQSDGRLPTGLQAAARTAQLSDPSQGPVGWDTYRHLDQLPTLPVGVQTQQFSSADPNGQNGDAGHTLGVAPDGSSILARHNGPGEIDTIWTTENGGDVTETGNIRVVLDGKTVLNAPEQDVVNGALGPPFVFPLVAKASQSSGGNYIDVPMPFTSSMLVTTRNNPVFYHVDYRSFASASGVSTFDPKQDPAQDVVGQLAASGTADPKGPQQGQTTTQATIAATPGTTDTLDPFQGPARINALQLTLPQLSPVAVAAPASPATVTTGSTTLPIDPNNNGVRVTRHLQSGSGTGGADFTVGGSKVASLPSPPPGATSKAHWADQVVTLPRSATSGRSSIQVAPSGPSSGSTFSYQVTNLASPAVAPRISATDDLLQNVRLQITFDGQQTVDAPLGQFFGSGLGQAKVKGLMVAVDPQTGTLSAWWPMPYAQQAVVALVNGSGQTLGGTASITTAPVPGEAQALGPSGQDGYFHATANAQNPTVPNQDYSFLAGGAWGKFVGVSETMRGLVPPDSNGLIYLEGNEQAYQDGSPAPQINGTGTEDFYNGGWYFNYGAFSDPLNGNPAEEGATGSCQFRCDSAYRLMLADGVPFSSSTSFGIQHGAVNTTPANYSSTAYWYGRLGASPSLSNPLSLQNGWAQAAGANVPSYVMEGSFVRLLGGVAGGAVGQPIATLPQGLAPRADEWFSVVTANNVVAPLVVHSNGTIVPMAGNPGFVSLSGIVLDVGSSTSYQPLGLQNGWRPAGSSTLAPGSAPGYVQNGSYVELTGGLTGGSAGQVVATLPANLRPPADEWFSVVTANNVVAPLVVHSNGTIVLVAGNPGFLSLSGIGVLVRAAPPANLGLQNGWSPAPGTNAPGFAQQGREVDLRGAARGGTAGQVVATLPVGARPAADESFPVVTANNVVAPLVVRHDGTAVLQAGNPAFLSLEDVRISAGVSSEVPTVPGAPTIGRATAGNASATVAFTPPASDGGSSITSYTATAKDLTNAARGGQSSSGPASPIIVGGLTNGDTYTFTVTATNAVGTGPPSADSNPVVPAVPTPEAVVSSNQFGIPNQTDVFTVGGDGAVQVRWIQGAGNWNGPLAISPPGLAPPGAHLAVSQQFGSGQQTDVFVVDKSGTVQVLWVQGGGSWNGPSPISPTGLAPAGAGLATSQQFGVPNQTDVFVVANNGATDVSWVAGAGNWGGPLGITPGGTAPPGAGLAASPQFGVPNQTDVFVVANNGAAEVSWVDGAGAWNGPDRISPTGLGPAGAALGASNQFGIGNQTDVFVVGTNGPVEVLWVDGAGAWNGPQGISQVGLAPAGSSVSTSNQFGIANQTDVFVVADNGAAQVMWVDGGGAWNGPQSI